MPAVATAPVNRPKAASAATSLLLRRVPSRMTEASSEIRAGIPLMSVNTPAGTVRTVNCEKAYMADYGHHTVSGPQAIPRSAYLR